MAFLNYCIITSWKSCILIFSLLGNAIFVDSKQSWFVFILKAVLRDNFSTILIYILCSVVFLREKRKRINHSIRSQLRIYLFHYQIKR